MDLGVKLGSNSDFTSSLWVSLVRLVPSKKDLDQTVLINFGTVMLSIYL